MTCMEKKFWAAVCLLICVTGLFTGKTLVSEAGSGQRTERELYRQMEKDYLRETGFVLEEAGFANSGMNLTKIVDGEGKRTYFMKIHNGRINALSGEEKEKLMIRLKSVSFADGQCEFYHEFFSTDSASAEN